MANLARDKSIVEKAFLRLIAEHYAKYYDSLVTAVPDIDDNQREGMIRAFEDNADDLGEDFVVARRNARGKAASIRYLQDLAGARKRYYTEIAEHSNIYPDVERRELIDAMKANDFMMRGFRDELQELRG